MSAVFLSYKREDEVRVVRLVRALESAKLSVWWDRSLASGESWRSQIQNALDSAQCVIVVWTHASVGPAGDFVRDEARDAKARNMLVPVLLDRVDPPMGFREIQAIDLTLWKGSTRDPSFEDLVAAISAKLDGRAVPPAKAPMKRLVRRLTYGSFASALLFVALAFGINLFRVQDRLCGMSLLQPGTSDVCGALGLGGRATKRERIAWENRVPGSCSALRTHVERFPDGAYREDAARMLVAKLVTQTEIWIASTRQLPMFESQGDVASANQAAAQAVALAHAQLQAERLCRGFAATTSFRFKSATPSPKIWNCNPIGKGVTCGFDGEVVCALDERRIEEHETCGK